MNRKMHECTRSVFKVIINLEALNTKPSLCLVQRQGKSISYSVYALVTYFVMCD